MASIGSRQFESPQGHPVAAEVVVVGGGVGSGEWGGSRRRFTSSGVTNANKSQALFAVSDENTCG